MPWLLNYSSQENYYLGIPVANNIYIYIYINTEITFLGTGFWEHLSHLPFWNTLQNERYNDVLAYHQTIDSTQVQLHFPRVLSSAEEIHLQGHIPLLHQPHRPHLCPPHRVPWLDNLLNGKEATLREASPDNPDLRMKSRGNPLSAWR